MVLVSRLVVAAALLSVGAAAIHATVAAPHFREWAPLGVLFVLAALAQAAWGALVLTAPSRRVLAAGTGLNLAILAAWVLSRTVGLPLGPDAWIPEPVAAPDAVASMFEAGIVAISVAVLRRGAPSRAPALGTTAGFAAVAAAVVFAITGTALAQDGGAGHDHGPDHHHTTPHPD